MSEKTPEQVVAEALAAGDSEPRAGRYEQTMADVAVRALRDAGRLLGPIQVAPLGWELDRDGVRGVWDTFVKPQQESGELQSIEDRMLMAILRAVYVALPPTEKEPNDA